ncbi:MAG: hypothetical protein SF187_20225 [Deltaproteobacteria bacterium]|nr:hypothetical protein [Deltaproteobacteria bacterium]
MPTNRNPRSHLHTIHCLPLLGCLVAWLGVTSCKEHPKSPMSEMANGTSPPTSELPPSVEPPVEAKADGATPPPVPADPPLPDWPFFKTIGTVEGTAASSVKSCNIIQIDPAIREDRIRANVKTMQDFTREIVYSAYPWRGADGAAIKLYRADAPGNTGRPQYWMAIAGSIPSAWDHSLNDLNENLLDQSALFAANSPYLLMVAFSIEQAVKSGKIPNHASLFFTGHSQGSNISSLLPLLLNGETLPALFPFAPPRWQRTKFVEVGKLLASHDISLGGGIGVAGRPMPFWATANAVTASTYGQQFSFVTVETDAVPTLGTADAEWAWMNASQLNGVAALSWLAADLAQGLVGLIRLGAENSFLKIDPEDFAGIEPQSALWFNDRKSRTAMNVHGQGYIDPTNSLRSMLAGDAAPPVCQDDLVFVPNNIDVFEVDFARNDFSVRADRGLPAALIGESNVVERSPGLPATFSQNGLLHVTLTGTPVAGSFARLVYSYDSEWHIPAGKGTSRSQCSVKVVFGAPDDPLLSDVHIRENGWKTFTPAFNATLRSADTKRTVTGDCEGCELPRTDVVYPADAPFIAYAPGFSFPWAANLRANNFPVIPFTLVDMYGYDCFSHIGIATAHQKLFLGTEGPIAVDVVKDICLPTTGAYVSHNDQMALKVLDHLSRQSVINNRNQRPDGVPDHLWVDGDNWGRPSAEADASRISPRWKQYEDVVRLWTQDGANESDNTFDLLFVPKNRNLTSCLEVKPCPDGQAPSILYPEDDSCPTLEPQTYYTGVGRPVVMPVLGAVASDDDWYFNMWVSEGDEDAATVKLQVPVVRNLIIDGKLILKVQPESAASLEWVQASREPQQPVSFVRDRGTAKPNASFQANKPGKYTLTYTLRNSRAGRRVGKITVEVGRWKGLWETEDHSADNPDFGGWCRADVVGGKGFGVQNRYLGYTVLDLGSDQAPLSVQGGTRVSPGGTCGSGPITETLGKIGMEDAGIFSLWKDAYTGATGHSHAQVSVGKLVCVGFDKGAADDSWAMCNKSRRELPREPLPCVEDICGAAGW